jgi:hypothetical protein
MKVTEMHRKIREKRLRWYGQISYPGNTILGSKANSKELVIFHTFALSEALSQNIVDRKLPRTNLKKGLLEIIKLFFVHLWHLRLW